MGSHVFAVYSRGNSDGYAGELWWAYSTDNGANWQQYPTPVMYGKYHSRFGPLGRTHVTLGSEAEGFGGASMAFLYEQGVLYAYIYTLYISPSRENHAVTAYLALTYKIRIVLSTASGLTSDRYILLRNTWTPHDGAFVFSSWPGYSYSPDSTYEPGAPFIGDYDSSWNETTGNIFVPSSVTHNGSVFVMLLGTHFSGDNNTTPLRYRVSSNGVDWCGPAGLDAGFGNTTDKGVYQIDISALATDANAAGPHHRSPVVGETSFHNSMWYGTLSGTTSYWGFLTLSRWAEDPAVPDGGDPDDGDWYNGSRILPVKFRLASNATFPGGCGVLPH